MLLEDVAELNAQYLQRLCGDGCPESQTLDFKRELPGNSDKEKHEFLKDVCSLANADGGDLVYGIQELDGVAESLVPVTSEAADVVKRRLTQVLDAGLEPRVSGIAFHHIEAGDGYALLVRVPASYDGPHCVRSNTNRRFVMRNGTGTTDMTYEQIRSAFDRTATLAERARRFIAARLDLVAQRGTPTPMMPGPVLALHLVPLAGVGERRSVDLREIYAQSFTGFADPDWGGASRHFNFDGLAIHPGRTAGGTYYTYAHVFRTGAIEAVRLGGTTRPLEEGGPERSIVWSLDMSKFFHSSATNCVTAAKRWGYGGPALLGVAILNVQGFELGIGGSSYPFSGVTADRPHLVPPEAWIDNLATVSVDDALRALLDVLWQAFGRERCPDFDVRTGAYSPRSS